MGNEGSEVNVDGAAKTPGTVTVRVTRSVEVKVRSEVVDVPVDVDMFEIVKVCSVVGKDPKDVVVMELVEVVELEDADELEEDIVVLVVVVEDVVTGTVTKTPGTEEVVVVALAELVVLELEDGAIVVFVLEAELVAAADSVIVTVTTETFDVVDADKPEDDDVVVMVVVNSDVVAAAKEDEAAVVVLEYDTVAEALP